MLLSFEYPPPLICPRGLYTPPKGFPKIEYDVLHQRGFLIIPPFKKRNSQFTDQENRLAYKIGN